MKITPKYIIQILLGITICISIFAGANCTEKNSDKNNQNFNISKFKF